MSLQRVLRMLASFFTGQGVSILSQLLVPPIFLSHYADGVEVYGEWIALSAAGTYLGTLNYGIQTFAKNQMTIDYNRGDVDKAKVMQASALRLIVLVMAVVAVLGLVVLVLPIGHWLNLRQTSDSAATLTLYALILLVLANMPFALLANSYMMIGRWDRGANWMNLQRLAAILGLAVCGWFRAPFPVIAMVQVIGCLVFTALVVIDVSRTARVVMPSLRYGSWRDVRPVLRPSGHFGLLSLSGFLTYQGPVLLIQVMLGPAAVTVFSLTRTVFSVSRQALSILSLSIGQEITLLIGQRNWPALKRLYELSERVILLLVPGSSVGMLLLSRYVFLIWLHRSDVYEPVVCFMMTVISAVTGIKEHKFQFQSSSNEHERLSKFTLGSYAAMLALAALLMKPLGVVGFMCAWLATELAQTVYIMRLNVQIFPSDMTICMSPVVKLLGILLVAYGLAAWPVFVGVDWSLPTLLVVAISLLLGVFAASYFTFGLEEIRLLLLARFRGYVTRKLT